MKISAKSSVGMRRSHNEDSFFTFNSKQYAYALVADGMGGVKAGEVASSMAANSIRKFIAEHITGSSDDWIEKILGDAIASANRAIYEYAMAKYNYTGMGTTASLAFIQGNKLYTAHVGDSRIYAIKTDEIKQLSVDHSYVNELVMRGVITPEQAKVHPKKNYITRAVGTEDTVIVDVNEFDYSGETILLCSDGLTNLVEDDELMQIVNSAKSYDEATKTLIKLANSRGGNDNITVVIIGK